MYFFPVEKDMKNLMASAVPFKPYDLRVNYDTHFIAHYCTDALLGLESE